MGIFLKGCARGALGLGAAALLLAVVPAHAGPAFEGAGLRSGAAARDNQPLQLVQSTTPKEEAAQAEKRRQQEQQQDSQQKSIKAKKMRGAMPRAASPEPGPVPEAAPRAPGSKRFGAGVVRHGDPGDSQEME
jgi:hypothetical protein